MKTPADVNFIPLKNQNLGIKIMATTAFTEEEYNKSFDLGLWKKVLSYTKPYRKYMYLLALVMIIVGSIDAIFPLLTKYAIDNYVVPGKTEKLLPFGILYGVIVTIQAINIWFLIALAGKIDMWVCYDIRKAGFQRLQELSFSYFDKTPVGWLMARMTSDSERLADTIAWGIVDFVWGFTMMVGISVIMLYLNWKLALIVLGVVPFLVWVSGKFQRLILKSYRQVRKTNSQITGAFNEGIMGAKTTKTLVREDANLGEFQILTGRMFSSSVRAAIQSSLYLPIVQLIGIGGSALVIWFGGSGVIMETITYGTLVAFISYTMRFFDPVRELARIFAEFQNAQASAERIFSMIETEPDIQDSPEVAEKVKSGESWEPIEGNIDFVNVGFEYKKGEKILHNFNLKVDKGETIALVGETGSGKSTIVNLVCRFYEPTEGKILIDGTDYRERSLHWLQSNIGVVLQAPHLFSGTIESNIRYGKLDATQEEIENAAKLVSAHAFITKLENGYQTDVGEGGGLLSTGQKQLISFARAILADPKILVLDEATSSVDTETEQLIQHAIEELLKGRTSFIIAHRLSTIRNADKILVISKGEIIEHGTHEDLLEKGGYYHRLYTNQFMDDTERISG